MRIEDILAKYHDIPQFSGRPLVDVNQKGFDDDTPLHVAVRRGDLEDVIAFLRHGANVNAIGDIGNTPLHEAASAGFDSIVKVLLRAGANPDLGNEFGQTPSDLAKMKMHETTINLLWKPPYSGV